MSQEWKEEFSVSGKELLEKVKELIREGNARRIIIKNETGTPLSKSRWRLEQRRRFWLPWWR